MQTFGLIGHPLSHSFSKSFFEKKFIDTHSGNHQYELFDIKTVEGIGLFKDSHPELRGLNVTIPYKTSVFKFLDDVSESA